MKNIIENNKLIAEFLEFNLTTDGIQTLYYDKQNSLKVLPKFHNDWNWLIGVVERIEGFEDENRCAKYNVNIQQCFVEIIDNHSSETIIEVDCNSKIQAVYNACVEFIKWYNKQK